MVEYIEYNGQKYPIRLGNYSIAVFEQEQGVTLDQLGKDVRLYEPLLFFALEQGHRFLKKELKLTREEMTFVLDECFLQFIETFPKFFHNQVSEEFLEKLKAVEGAGKKKKQTGTKSVVKQ